MKGLLLEEFYSWRKTGIWYALMYVVIGAAYGILGGLSGVLLGFMIGSVNRIFLEDEKSCWSDFSRTLPCSTAQRVSARYIIMMLEMFLATAALVVSGASSTFNDNKLFKFSEYFPHLSNQHIVVSSAVLAISAVIFGIAVTMPLNYLFKGNKRAIIGSIPMVVVAVAVVLIYMVPVFSLLPKGSNMLTELMFYEKWLMPVMIAVSVAAFAVSWLVSIIINTNSGKEKLGKIKAVSIILVVAIAATGAASVGVVYKKGWFSKGKIDYEEFYYENLDDYLSSKNEIVDLQSKIEEEQRKKQQQECRVEMMKLVEGFCIDNHLGRTVNDVQQNIKDMGFEEMDYTIFEYRKGSDQYNSTIVVYPETNTDRIVTVDATADVGDSNRIEEATDKELDKIGSSFTVGMTDAQVIEKLKEYGYCPSLVREYEDPDHGRTKYYMINLYIAKYNGDEYARYQIHLEVGEEGVWDARFYTK